MTNPKGHVIGYLSPSIDSAWQWTNDGDAVVWADGSTIAFRQEIQSLIERLAPTGLPRFGAIILLLAACRDNWSVSSGRATVEKITRQFGRSLPSAPGVVPLFAFISQSVQKTLDQLDAVSRLPGEVRHGPLAKAILLETVFESGKKQLTADVAAAVVSELAAGFCPNARLLNAEPLREFASDCEALQPGLGLVNAEALAMRARTGLDEPILPAELDLPAAERTSRLLDELREDTEFAGLARVAQQLMAAVHVPRFLHAREELPVGGVSDLANRGSLDRLLISELANDSLTLAVRVALNEALYLRRESPPRNPPHRRAILLDCGIRLWGIPRTFAIAAGLAFAATTDRKAEVSAFRAAGKAVEPIDLTNRAGLVACMAALDAQPHPGESLEPFFQAIDDRTAPADAILITHPDVLSDPGFSLALSRCGVELVYIATVSDDGHFQMFAITAAGRKRVTEAQLDLQTLFAGRSASTKLLARNPSLPAIWSVSPFPLRLPCTIKPESAIGSDELGLVGVSRDGRLLHWDREGLHARQIHMTLPRRPLLGLFHVPAMNSVVAVFEPARDHGARLIRYHLDTATVDTTELNLKTSNPSEACVVGHACVISAKDSIEAFSLHDGAPLGALSLTCAQKTYRRFGRFVLLASGWHAIAFDGQSLRLEKLALSAVRTAIMVIEPGDSSEPATICSDGSFWTSTGTQPIVTGRFYAASPLGVSHDGGRYAIRAEGKVYGIDSQKCGAEWIALTRPLAEYLAGPYFHRSLQFPGMMPAACLGIYVNEQQQLALVSSRYQEWILAVDVNSRCRLTQHPTRSVDLAGLRLFAAVKLPDDIRIRLFEAKWEDGSRAFVDSRRLLHLKSSDPALPEITLALSLDPLAVSGWSSDGRIFGSKQFLLGAAPAPDEELAELVRQFVLRLR